MKAVNDYRILMPNIPYYETGLQFNQFDVVYYTGIYGVSGPFNTGYYYATGKLNSGINNINARPDVVTGPNVWTQNYFFVPCYGSTINFKANYYQNNFQDYYKVIVGKSANIIHCEASLQFKGVSDNEAKALNHFYQNSFVSSPLSDGQGHKTVNMYLFPPHTKIRPFYLKSIDNNFENADFNNITLNVESPFISSTDWKQKLIPFTSAQLYNSNKTYSKHDYIFVKDLGSSNQNGFYYFSGNNPTSNQYPPYEPWTDKFYFDADLVQQLTFESAVYKNDLGNFYLYQDIGLNPNSFVFNLSFNNRTDKEAQAILHFLENHNGIDVFDYDMYAYFTGTRSFFCPEWSHTYNFLNNNTISAKFIEFKFSLDRQITFNTELKPTGFNFGFLPQGFSRTHRYEVGNNTRRYAITYSIGNKIEIPTYSSSFFNYSDLENSSIQVEAGRTGYFDIVFSIPQNVSTGENKDLRGYFPITQESENLGLQGSDLKIYYTGLRVNTGEFAPYNFLSGVQNCVASPVYNQESDSLGLKVRWTLPGSGYYFTGFSGRISTNSGFSPLSSVTGLTLPVSINSNTNLYEIGTPNEELYNLTFSGLKFNTPYYISIYGLNNTYGNATGQWVFASGVSDSDSWLNPSEQYEAVNSGLTTGILSTLGIHPPSITIYKDIKQLKIYNSEFDYFDLYDYIVKKFPYGNRFDYYSGLIIDFIDTNIGPTRPTRVYSIYDTGSFIITGDYSLMPSGITLNFYNNSFVYGKGGSVVRPNNDSLKQGKNAIYIKCSGLININVDDTSLIAGGGGAGENINIEDLAPLKNNKYDQLTPAIGYLDGYEGLNYTQYNVTYNQNQITNVVNDFNKTQNVNILNSTFCSTLGAGLFYDFFDTGVSNPPLVYGGAGAPFGRGTGTIFQNNTLINVDDAGIVNPSVPYQLINIITLQKDVFPTK